MTSVWGVSSLQLVKADVHTSVPPWGSAMSYWGSKPYLSTKGTQHCFFVFFFSPKKILLGRDKYHSESIHSTDIEKYYKSEPFPKELATNIYKLLFFMDPAGIL